MNNCGSCYNKMCPAQGNSTVQYSTCREHMTIQQWQSKEKADKALRTLAGKTKKVSLLSTIAL